MVLIDQAKFAEALRQNRASNFNLAVGLGLQLADCPLKIILNKPGVGADRLQRPRATGVTYVLGTACHLCVRVGQG
jgi:hypothetical protein